MMTDTASLGGSEYFFILPNLIVQSFNYTMRLVIKISFVYFCSKIPFTN